MTSLLKGQEWSFMINVEKTKLMTKCSIYEKHDGSEDIEISKYFRPDYVRFNVVKTIVFTTLGYLIFCGMYLIYNLNMFIEKAFIIDYKTLLTKIIGFYIIFIIIYVAASLFIYNLKYKNSRGRVSDYYRNLGRINKMNEKDEKIKELEED